MRPATYVCRAEASGTAHAPRWWVTAPAAVLGSPGRLRVTSAAARRGSATTVRAAQLGAFRPPHRAGGAGAAAASRRAPRPRRRCASGRTRSYRRSAFSPRWRPSRPTVLLPKAAPTPRSPEAPGPASRRLPSTTTPKVEREWPDSSVRQSSDRKGLTGRGAKEPRPRRKRRAGASRGLPKAAFSSRAGWGGGGVWRKLPSFPEGGRVRVARM